MTMGHARFTFRWQGVTLLAAGALLLLGGCTSNREEIRADAERRWGEIRSRIKLQLARQQFDMGHAADAEEFASEALALDATNPEVFIMLAKSRLELGKVAGAERAIMRAQEIAPISSELAAVSGLVAERQQRTDLALAYYQQARALDDSRVEYLLAEAECLVALDRADEALAVLRSELVSYDNDPALLMLLGEVALHQGRKTEALQWFRAVHSVGEIDPVIAEEYALLASEAGQHAEALTVLEPMLAERDQRPVPSSIIRAAAEAFLVVGREEEAKLALRELIKEDPTDVTSCWLLARAGMATGDFPTTRQGIYGALRIAPDDPRTQLLAAFVWLQEGHFDQARGALDSLLAANEDDVLAHCLMGAMAMREKNLRQAQQHYQRALQIDPHCVWAQAALATRDGATVVRPTSALSASQHLSEALARPVR